MYHAQARYIYYSAQLGEKMKEREMQRLKQKLRSFFVIFLLALIVADLALGWLMNPRNSKSEEKPQHLGGVSLAVTNNPTSAKPTPMKVSKLSYSREKAEKQNLEEETESLLVLEFASLLNQGYEPTAALALATQLWVSGELPRQPQQDMVLLGENEEEEQKSDANNSSEENGAVEVPEAKKSTLAAEATNRDEPVPARTAPPAEIHGQVGQITVESTTAERIWWTFDYLIGEGFTPEAAAAVIGNIAVESSFNPSVVSSAGYYGLFQWNTSSGGGYWWYDIQEWLTSNGYEWNSYEGQMRAFLNCSNRGFLTDSRLDTLKNLTNVEQAVEMIAVFYEGCVGGSELTEYYSRGNAYQGLKLRKSEAWVAYFMYCDGSWEYTGQKPYYS